jgi:hypothetical protein
LASLHPQLLAHIAAMPFEQFARTVAAIESPAIRRAALRYRFITDRASFLKYCFPRLFKRPFNAYHLDVLTRPWPSWRERQERGESILEADAAPRGIAKTTLAKGELVWALLHDIEAMAVVISNEMSLSTAIAGHIMRIFAKPPKPLADLYGPFKVTGGVESFRVEFADGRTAAVIAKSMSSQLRGVNDDAVRPTIVLLDDAERSDRVRSAKQRRVWWERLHEDVLKFGDIGQGLYVRLRGTVLHPDSGLANLLKAPGWTATRYQACPSYEENAADREWTALWNECGALYNDLNLGKDERTRTAIARAFYEANREVMDRGVVMLDPVALPIFSFMKLIWSQGLKSVLQELQNQPRAAGTKFFEVDKFKRCKVVGTKQSDGYLVRSDGRKVKLADLRTYARLDPIPGDELGTMGEDGAGAGDYACIVILGRDDLGYGYVLDVWLKRARDSEQLAVLWALSESWGVEKATIEKNGFQRLLGREFRRQQEERRKANLYCDVVPEEDTSTKKKEERIASLEGPLTAGHLEIAEGISETAILQMDSFPDGDHDDFCDAMEGAWRLSNSVRIGMINRPIQRAA